jgi:hypothetical protein
MTPSSRQGKDKDVDWRETNLSFSDHYWQKSKKGTTMGFGDSCENGGKFIWRRVWLGSECHV